MISTYVSSMVIPIQNRLSIQSEARLTFDFNLLIFHCNIYTELSDYRVWSPPHTRFQLIFHGNIYTEPSVYRVGDLPHTWRQHGNIYTELSIYRVGGPRLRLHGITYLSSTVISIQNRLSIESEARLTHDFNFRVSPTCVWKQISDKIQ